MSISGLFLILFLVFHLCMNIAAVFSGEAYNVICGLLGSNWYALLGTLVLAAGVVVHFVYAIILTLQNRKARGNDRYAINARPKGVDWASQNMFVLGVIVIHLFLVPLLLSSRYNMMFAGTGEVFMVTFIRRMVQRLSISLLPGQCCEYGCCI
ncbi:MAG: hypothetical protein ACLRS8_09320 [Parabacteroides merdae]